MERVDEDAGDGHASEQSQTLRDLFVLARGGSTAVVVSGIGKHRGRRADRGPNRESVPQRITIAAYLTDITGSKLL